MPNVFALGPNAVGHIDLTTGEVFICDPDAPIEHGSIVLAAIDNMHLVGRCLTKVPSKAKRGITLGLKGNPDPISGCGDPRGPSKVYRVVLSVPPLFPKLRLGPNQALEFKHSQCGDAHA